METYSAAVICQTLLGFTGMFVWYRIGLSKRSTKKDWGYLRCARKVTWPSRNIRLRSQCHSLTRLSIWISDLSLKGKNKAKTEDGPSRWFSPVPLSTVFNAVVWSFWSSVVPFPESASWASSSEGKTHANPQISRPHPPGSNPTQQKERCWRMM